MNRALSTLSALALLASTAVAQRSLKTIPDPDVNKQLATFTMAEGFEISLFAADPMFAKPIQMNWDPAGRLWVASSATYPQIKPSQVASDTIVVLEDTTGDGKADKRTVFADGLLIPTAVMPYKNGAFVANATDLLFLEDTDGDGKADKRTVVLSGFGTEDTHHILHTFRWGPDGRLYMNQSIYIHSHIETPYGPRRLGAGGTWRFDPDTLRLEVMTRGLINHWGHHFDYWGQSFATDGAGGEGINYLFPGSVHRTAKSKSRPIKGLNPGQPKLAGLEILSGRHLPEEWRGNMIAHDFRGHRTARFIISEDGSGYASRRDKDLVSTPHAAFRPVDVKMGPDGAIYIADWYNPIIQHGEVDFRDERRDHTHGRIWRVTASGRDLVKKPTLVGAPVKALLESLKAPEQWTREQAKRVLAEREKKSVVGPTLVWANTLDPKAENYVHHLLEAMWVLQSHHELNAGLVSTIQDAGEPRALAAAIRCVKTWALDHPAAHDAPWIKALQQKGITHKHPRVRLETIHLLHQHASAASIKLAMQALDQTTDRFIDFALTQTLQENEDTWLEPLQSGQLPFEKASHLLYALKSSGSTSAIGSLTKLLDAPALSAADRQDVLTILAESGGPKELNVVMAAALENDNPGRLALLQAMVRASQGPNKDIGKIESLLNDESRAVRQATITLIGKWKTPNAFDTLNALVVNEAASAPDKLTAVKALGALRTAPSKKALAELVGNANATGAVRMAALTEHVRATGKGSITLLTTHLPSLGGADPHELMTVFLAHREGPSWLQAGLSNMTLPSDLAAASVRTVGSSGVGKTGALVAALIKAGGLQPLPAKLSDEEMTALVADVATKGSGQRGESVYRRATLACLNCHAIGGAGGVVGPDLVSIGASAPVDYLIESLFEPSKKVKEGYHLTTLLLKDGTLLTGMVVQKTDKDVIIRDATGNETTVPAKSVKSQTIVPTSLMPPGLTASLRRDEMVDLLRFLSELGKDGDFKVGPTRYVRRFRTAVDPRAAAGTVHKHGVAAFAQTPEIIDWTPAYTRVNGQLLTSDYTPFSSRRLKGHVFQFTISVTTPGEIGMALTRTTGIEMWIDGISAEPKALTVAKLTRGEHLITLVVAEDADADVLSIAIEEIPGSPAKAQAVSGP